MRRWCLPVLLSLAALGAGASAHAAVVLDSPVALNATGSVPRFLFPAGGDDVAVWGRGYGSDQPPPGDEGVYVVRRRPGQGWPAATRISTDNVNAVLGADAPDGTVAVAWGRPGGTDPVSPPTVHLSLAPPGGTFGAPEPMPVTQPSKGYTLPVAIAFAGSTLVAATAEHDYDTGYKRIVAIERAPNGTYLAPVELAPRAADVPRLVTSAGRAVVLWSAPPPGERLPRRVYVSERTGPGAWTAPLALSPADSDAGNGALPLHLVGTPRGDLLAAWDASPYSSTGGMPLFPETIMGAVRAPGGAWGPATELSSVRGTGGMRPTAALAPGGGGAVAWLGGRGPALAVKSPDGPFAAPLMADTGGGERRELPLAHDDAGRSVLIAQVETAPYTRPWAVFAAEPGGCLTRHALLTPPGTPATVEVIAGRADGSGMIGWTDLSGGKRTVYVTDFRHDPSTPAPECPKPPAPAPGTITLEPDPIRLAVGPTPKRVTRRALLRTGIRVVLTPSRAASVEAVLIGVRRGSGRRIEVVAHRKLGAVAARTAIRVRGRAKALNRVARGTPLTLVLVARDGAVSDTVQRRIRLR